MPELTAKEAAVQENQRVMGIIGCPEAKGREQLAQMLAGQPGMSVAQAQAILAAAGPQQEVVSEADRILALDEAKGREALAATLAGMPEMTAERAKTILAASPQVSSTSLSDSILALDEAKGREELAARLAEMPDMSLENARELLSAAPCAADYEPTGALDAFEQYMSMQSPQAISAGEGKEGDLEMKLMMSIPGTPAAEKELNNDH